MQTRSIFGNRPKYNNLTTTAVVGVKRKKVVNPTKKEHVHIKYYYIYTHFPLKQRQQSLSGNKPGCTVNNNNRPDAIFKDAVYIKWFFV